MQVYSTSAHSISLGNPHPSESSFAVRFHLPVGFEATYISYTQLRLSIPCQNRWRKLLFAMILQIRAPIAIGPSFRLTCSSRSLALSRSQISSAQVPSVDPGASFIWRPVVSGCARRNRVPASFTHLATVMLTRSLCITCLPTSFTTSLYRSLPSAHATSWAPPTAGLSLRMSGRISY